MIPFRLYGDGADAQQHFEIMTMLPTLAVSSSTLDSRILLSVRNTDKTTTVARTRILEVTSWSLKALSNSAVKYKFLISILHLVTDRGNHQQINGGMPFQV